MLFLKISKSSLYRRKKQKYEQLWPWKSFLFWLLLSFAHSTSEKKALKSWNSILINQVNASLKLKLKEVLVLSKKKLLTIGYTFTKENQVRPKKLHFNVFAKNSAPFFLGILNTKLLTTNSLIRMESYTKFVKSGILLLGSLGLRYSCWFVDYSFKLSDCFCCRIRCKSR